jgi:ABC-type polysaccharide/polyol phosphate transport system ATPase subunit
MNPSSPSGSESPAAASPLRVRAEGLVKSFPVDRQRRSAFLGLKQLLRGEGRARFTALAGLDFEVRAGERVAVIGDNGAGKTTLLKTVAGLYRADGGRLFVGGSVTLVSGLAIGMIDDLTVSENVVLYGAIYGIDRETLRSRFDEIIAWAELGEFVDAKLKHLSSGMKTRLAFSAVRHVGADLYLLDEALTAGDRRFREKCGAVFEEYRRSDRTFLVATHDLDFAASFCTHALWIHKGRQQAFGDAREVVGRYTGARRE